MERGGKPEVVAIRNRWARSFSQEEIENRLSEEESQRPSNYIKRRRREPGCMDRHRKRETYFRVKIIWALFRNFRGKGTLLTGCKNQRPATPSDIARKMKQPIRDRNDKKGAQGSSLQPAP